MRLLTSSVDEKIKADNHLIEMNIGEYASIALGILSNNDLQRKRVKTANRTYSLLKDDIKIGCVIPSIVLAVFPNEQTEQQLNSGTSNQQVAQQVSATEIINASNIVTKIEEGKLRLLILDGLQRTYTIIDLLSEVAGEPTLLAKIKALPLRIEIYAGISKVGVLYRMLTLNTGQTPMSTRHQVEMIYSDYKNGFDGLIFISEAENRLPTGDNEFKFSDILDCFLSYITGDYLPIEREDLVAIIKNLEALTKDDKQKDLFKLLINTYNQFRLKIRTISGNWQYDETVGELNKKPFAKNVNELFSKIQLLAGFGAAVSFLIKNELIVGIEDIQAKIELLKADNIDDGLNALIKDLYSIQVNAKKMGSEQRMYFYYFVRSLFNEANDGYLDTEKSVKQAYTFYSANTLK